MEKNAITTPTDSENHQTKDKNSQIVRRQKTKRKSRSRIKTLKIGLNLNSNNFFKSKAQTLFKENTSIKKESQLKKIPCQCNSRINRIFKIKSRRLELQDLGMLPPRVKSDFCYNSLKNYVRRLGHIGALKVRHLMAENLINQFKNKNKKPKKEKYYLDPYFKMTTINVRFLTGLKIAESILSVLTPIITSFYLRNLKKVLEKKDEVGVEEHTDDIRKTWFMIFLVTILIVVKKILREIYLKNLCGLKAKTGQTLRTLLFHKFLSSNKTFLKLVDKSIVTKFLNHDIDKITRYISIIPNIVTLPIILILTLFSIAYYVGFNISFIVLIIFGFFGLFLAILNFKISKFFLQYQNIRRIKENLLIEILKGVKEVRFLNLEKYFLGKLEEIRKKEEKVLSSISLSKAWIKLINLVLPLICTVFVLVAFNALNEKNESLSPLYAFMVIAAVNQIQTPLNIFNSVIEAKRDFIIANNHWNALFLKVSDYNEEIESVDEKGYLQNQHVNFEIDEKKTEIGSLSAKNIIVISHDEIFVQNLINRLYSSGEAIEKKIKKESKEREKRKKESGVTISVKKGEDEEDGGKKNLFLEGLKNLGGDKTSKKEEKKERFFYRKNSKKQHISLTPKHMSNHNIQFPSFYSPKFAKMENESSKSQISFRNFLDKKRRNISDSSKKRDLTRSEILKLTLKNTKKQQKFKVENIDLTFEINQSEKICLMGDEISGIQSFIEALLNESRILKGTLKVRGSIGSLITDNPVFLSGESIKNNIIFGETFNRMRYKSILQLIHLELENMKAADQTEVLEFGKNLSSIQKAKIMLGRLVYSDHDIYIFDNFFDCHNSKEFEKLFEKIIRGYLKNKTVIYVSNHEKFMKFSDQVFIFEQGELRVKSNYDELIRAKGSYLFNKLIKLEKEKTSDKLKSKGKLIQAVKRISIARKVRKISKIKNKFFLLKMQRMNSEIRELSEVKKEQTHLIIKALFNHLKRLKNGKITKEFESAIQKSMVSLLFTHLYGKKIFKTFMILLISLLPNLILTIQYTFLGAWSGKLKEFKIFWVNLLKENDNTLTRYLVIYFSISLAFSMMSFIKILMMQKILIKSSTNLFNKMCKKLFKTKIHWFMINSTTNVLKRLTTDQEIIDKEINADIEKTQDAFFLITASLLVINFTFFKTLIIPSILMILYLFFLLKSFNWTTMSLINMHGSIKAKLQSVLEMTLNSSVYFRMQDQQDYLLNYFYTINDEYQRITTHLMNFSMRWLGLRITCSSAVLIFCCLISPFLSSEYLGIDYKGNFWVIALSVSWCIRLLDYVQAFCGSLASARVKSISIGKILDFLENENEEFFKEEILKQKKKLILPILDDEDNIFQQGSEYSLVLQSVKINIDNQKILNNMNLKVKKGEMMAIIGNSSSRKYMLFDVILGMYTHDNHHTTCEVCLDCVQKSRIQKKILEKDPKITDEELKKLKTLNCTNPPMIKVLGQTLTIENISKIREKIFCLMNSPFLFKGSIMQNIDPYQVESKEKIIKILSKLRLIECLNFVTEKQQWEEELMGDHEKRKKVNKRECSMIKRMKRRAKTVIKKKAFIKDENENLKETKDPRVRFMHRAFLCAFMEHVYKVLEKDEELVEDMEEKVNIAFSIVKSSRSITLDRSMKKGERVNFVKNFDQNKKALGFENGIIMEELKEDSYSMEEFKKDSHSNGSESEKSHHLILLNRNKKSGNLDINSRRKRKSKTEMNAEKKLTIQELDILDEININIRPKLEKRCSLAPPSKNSKKKVICLPIEIPSFKEFRRRSTLKSPTKKIEILSDLSSLKSERSKYSNMNNISERDVIEEFLEYEVKNNLKDIPIDIKKIILACRALIYQPKIVLVEDKALTFNGFDNGYNLKIFQEMLPSETSIISMVEDMKVLGKFDEVSLVENGQIMKRGRINELLFEEERKKKWLWKFLYQKGEVAALDNFEAEGVDENVDNGSRISIRDAEELVNLGEEMTEVGKIHDTGRGKIPQLRFAVNHFEQSLDEIGEVYDKFVEDLERNQFGVEQGMSARVIEKVLDEDSHLLDAGMMRKYDKANESDGSLFPTNVLGKKKQIPGVSGFKEVVN